ncbi:MAG: hypothetical protein ACK51V_01540 [bacterium]
MKKRIGVPGGELGDVFKFVSHLPELLKAQHHDFVSAVRSRLPNKPFFCNTPVQQRRANERHLLSPTVAERMECLRHLVRLVEPSQQIVGAVVLQMVFWAGER